MGHETLKIVIVDDHEAIRRGVRSSIGGLENIQIVGEAADGHEALRLVRNVQPDIAILDYSLPLMNGLELTRAIRHQAPCCSVLIYTIHDQEGLLAEIMRAGARGYVLKSDPVSQLVSAVTALAAHKVYFSSAISEHLLNHFVERAHGRDSLAVITSREREIIQLIAEGKINKQIAFLLDISIKTVETHRASAMHKLKLRTTAELVLYAVRNNIVQP